MSNVREPICIGFFFKELHKGNINRMFHSRVVLLKPSKSVIFVENLCVHFCSINFFKL